MKIYERSKNDSKRSLWISSQTSNCYSPTAVVALHGFPLKPSSLKDRNQK